MAFASGIVLAAAGSLAQTSQDAKAQLEKQRQQLEDKRKAEKALASDVSSLRAEREQINQGLLDLARLIQKSEAQLNSIEARVGELEAQEKLLKGSLAQRHDQIAKLLAAMQRMGRNPPPVMITRREDALQMVRSAMLLAAAFPEMRDQAMALAGRLSELAQVMEASRAEGERLKAETQRINEQRTQLAMLMESRKTLLAERQSELDRVRREAAEITNSVNDLNELIEKLDKAVARHVGQDIAAGPPARETGQEAPAAGGPATPGETVIATGPRPISPDADPTAADLRPSLPPGRVPDNSVEIAPSKSTRVASADLGRLKPAVPFSRVKGHLQLPALGRRVLGFGERTQYGEKSKGIVLETRPHAQVTAPSDAWVVFAGAFRSFGQLLILNAGEGYHILLAGLSQIDVQVGEFVLAGQPVGVMTGPARAGRTRAADAAPVLYIEFRKDGRPIDSAPWWVEDSRQKVQG